MSNIPDKYAIKSENPQSSMVFPELKTAMILRQAQDDKDL